MIVLAGLTEAVVYATVTWENPVGGGAPNQGTPQVHGVFGTVNITAIDLSPNGYYGIFQSGTNANLPFSGVTHSLAIQSIDFYRINGLQIVVFPQTGGSVELTVLTRLTLSDVWMVLTYADGTVVTVRPQKSLTGYGWPNITTIVSITHTTCVITRQAFGGIPSTSYAQFYQWGVPTSISAPDWLIVNEPVLGITNRTNYLFKGDGSQHSWSLQLRQRGQATIHLYVAAGDNYAPTRGTAVYLFDQTATFKSPRTSVWQLVFSGLIQDIENQWIGTKGDRFVIVTAVSLESVFDTVYAPPTQFVNQNCGAIVTALFNLFEAGCPVSLGTIAPGPVVPLLVTNYEKLSDLFDQLATTGGFTWSVDPAKAQLNFGSLAISPFTLNTANILWDTCNWKQTGADYRNRQAVRLSYDAFAHSCEFFVGAGQTAITLARPCQQVTNAWATLSTCNTATGTFSTPPQPGDTVTTGPYNVVWQAARIYATGGLVIDANNYVQKATTAGTSAGSGPPAFSDITTGTTIDGTVIWTCLGPAGLATGTQTYTFVLPYIASQWAPGFAYGNGAVVNSGNFIQTVTAGGTSGSTPPLFSSIPGDTTLDGSVTWVCSGPCLDNRQFGHVLLTGDYAQNLADAINARVTDAFGNQLRGVTYSLPTWENVFCNAINIVSVTSFTMQQKHAGSGWLTVLFSTSGIPNGWTALASYATGAIILSGTFPTQFIQQVTVPGISGASSPSFNTGTMGTTPGDGAVTWTCLGPARAFTWNSTSTFNGTSPQGSLGPGEGATISLQVYVAGTSVAAPGLAYTPGSASLTLATPLNVGSNLNVEYTRADGNVIEVENTPLVAAYALLTNGTGEVQQIVDASSQGLISNSATAGLQLAQQALAAYSIAPQAFSFIIYDPGISPGQLLTVLLVLPSGAAALLNGQWIVESVSAELVPVWHGGATPYLPGFGHYKYTVRVINIQEIGSELDFWEGLGGGGSGGGSASGLVATSGGGLAAVPGGSAVATWAAEVPGGTLNGINVAFTLSNTPVAGSLTLMVNILQREGTDFTVSGSTITLAVAPKLTDTGWFYARYQH